MKRLLLSSLIAALLVGSSIGFVSHALSFRGGAKYDPPIPEDEWEKMRELPIAKAEEILRARRKPLTRVEWIEDSVGHPYFWKGVARHSVAPIIGVFIACVVVGRLSDYERMRPERGKT